MILGNKNGVIPFQESPRNAFCKNGILLKIPLFSKPNFNTNFSIKHHNSIIYVQPIVFFMLLKSLGYAINKFGRFYRLPEKIAIFKKILSHELKQRLFYQ